MYEKELFADYELDNSSRDKIILNLLGGSAILHVIILLFLIYVPAVRDAFYLAMLFSDAPTGWVSKEFNETEIGADETASIINLPPSSQLQYPAGYFNLANGDAPAPDMIAMTTVPAPEVVSVDDGSIPEFPGLLVDQLTTAPTPVQSEFNDPIPALPINRKSSANLPPKLKIRKGATVPPFEAADSKDDEISAVPRSSATIEPKTSETAKASPAPAPNPTNSLNSEPLKILAAKAIRQINNKEIDLNKTVNVTIKGALDDKGKLVSKQTTYKNNGGDEKLASMAAELVSAMNDSGMLEYVKLLSDGAGKREIVFNISKDEKDVKFQLVSITGDEAKANSIASGLNLAFGFFKNNKRGTEEGELLEKVEFTTNKNQVIINWRMDTPTAMRKIQNKLDKIAAEQKANPISSTANSNSQAAIK